MTIKDGSTLDIEADFTNNGTILIDHSTFKVNGTFIENGHFNTDAATLEFGSLVIGPTGSMTTGTGDLIEIAGDFTDQSTDGTLTEAGATLEFIGFGIHQFSTDNDLTIADLIVGKGATLDLTGTGTLNLGELILPDENPADIGSEIQSTLTITYNATDPANAYLLDQSYTLSNGATLSPAVPEASGASLLASAFMVFLTHRRRGTADQRPLRAGR